MKNVSGNKKTHPLTKRMKRDLGDLLEGYGILVLGERSKEMKRFVEETRKAKMLIIRKAKPSECYKSSEELMDAVLVAEKALRKEADAQIHRAIELIVSDILINFDDARSEATLKVLAELSRKTQIVFFTHHRHLLNLAESAASPDLLKVHRLTGSSGTA